MDFEKLTAAVAELDEDAVKEFLAEVMSDGGTQANQAMEACQKGLDRIGQLYEDGEYFVGDLIYAGELMTDALETLKPGLVSDDAAGGAKARMIICTVKDDLHDIGKNIVKAMLEANGFDVLDLGIDTPPEKILEEAKANGIKIVALSGVLTLSLESMKKTVALLHSEIPGCHVIIGGAPVTAEACAGMNADAWAHSPQKTVNACRAWAEEK